MAYHQFQQTPTVKRKRLPDDFDELVSEQSRESKRSNLTRLPIRTSPTTSQNYAWHTLPSHIQQPLTPVDSSDDEAHGQAENPWFSRRVAGTPNRHSSSYRLPLATIAGPNSDEMDIGIPNVTPARRRTPSPSSSLSLLQVSTELLEDRAPTPIVAKFNLFQDSAKSRGRHIIHHTMLSPMLVEETYLPSPIELDDVPETPDRETTICMEDASSDFGALSVECKDDDVMQDAMQDCFPRKNESFKPSKDNRGRNAKLHMGFLADCEKCQQRVPGHYSHIIWT